MTDKQKTIWRYIREQGGTCTRRSIVNQFSWWYYCNADKHVGNILTTMVQNNMLERKKRGEYTIPTRNKKTTQGELFQ